MYYACFYSASAVLLHQNKRFSKHAGLRAALHQHLVKAGRLGRDYGKFFDQAFEDRHEADYGALVQFEATTVAARIDGAEPFVAEMRRLLPDA